MRVFQYTIIVLLFLGLFTSWLSIPGPFINELIAPSLSTQANADTDGFMIKAILMLVGILGLYTLLFYSVYYAKNSRKASFIGVIVSVIVIVGILLLRGIFYINITGVNSGIDDFWDFGVGPYYSLVFIFILLITYLMVLSKKDYLNYNKPPTLPFLGVVLGFCTLVCCYLVYINQMAK